MGDFWEDIVVLAVRAEVALRQLDEDQTNGLDPIDEQYLHYAHPFRKAAEKVCAKFEIPNVQALELASHKAHAEAIFVRWVKVAEQFGIQAPPRSAFDQDQNLCHWYVSVVLSLKEVEESGLPFRLNLF